MRLALIAHDEKKADLIDFAQTHEELLATCDLVATGTTGKRLRAETALDVERKLSGPQGGDLQIGSEVAEGDCHGIVFFRDPLTAQPHSCGSATSTTFRSRRTGRAPPPTSRR